MNWQDQLPAYINDTLPADERRELETLLQESPDAQETLNEWSAISLAVQAEARGRVVSPPPVFADVWTRHNTHNTLRFNRTVKVVGTLAAALCLLVLGFLALQREEEPVQTTWLQPQTIQLVEHHRFGRGHLNNLIWSPDGTTIAAPGALGTWLYNADDLDIEPLLLPAETEAAVFSSDSTLLATSHPDGKVNIWTLPFGELRTTIETRQRYRHNMAFSPDNARLVTTRTDQTIVMWDVSTGDSLLELYYDDVAEGIACLAFDHEQPYFYTVHTSWQRRTSPRLLVWDYQGDRVDEVEFSDARDYVSCSFSGDGTRFVLVSPMTAISVFDVPTRTELLLSEDYRMMGVYTAQLNQTGDLAVAHQSELIAAWDVETGEIIRTMPIYPDQIDDTGHYQWTQDSTLASDPVAAQMLGFVWRFALSFDSTQVVILYENGVVARLPLTESGQAQALLAHRNLGRNSLYIPDSMPITFSPDSRHVFAGVEGTGVQVWDVETGEPSEIVVQRAASRLRGMAYNSVENRLVVALEAVRSIILMNVPYTPPLAGSHVYIVDDDELFDPIWLWSDTIRAFALHPDGQQFAVSPMTDTASISIVDIETREVEEMPVPLPANILVYSPDGTLLAIASENKVWIWNLAEGEMVFTFTERHGTEVDDIAFSPDGHMLAIAHQTTLLLLDAASFSKLSDFQTPGPIQTISFSPTGDLIAIGTRYRGLILVGVENNAVVATTDEIAIAGVAFNPDGNLIATAGFDGTVRIWSIENTVE